MNREEIRDTFQELNPEITDRVLTETAMNTLLKLGDKDFCARTRCITNDTPETISTTENDESWDLSTEISKFYDIDTFPGGGVSYNDERLDLVTIAQLDEIDEGWRTASAGTPEYYFRRGAKIYTNCPIDSNADDLKVYAVLISNDFDSDIKTPFNERAELEPYHYGLVLWLQWKAKAKIGKREDALTAMQEYIDYTKWVKRELGGNKFSEIYFRPKN
jgi:hypothetical protein